MANVRSVVRFMSDEQAQRVAWFGPHTSVIWYPDELLAKFFDDLFFGEFLCSPTVNLTDRQRAAGKSLKAKLKAFSDSAPAHPEPKHMIDEQPWAEIREAATVFLNTLS
jgi:hypothetical protein